MTDTEFKDALLKAFSSTIQKVGMTLFKATTMFGSSK